MQVKNPSSLSNMAVENHIYGPDVLISPHTNRPIEESIVKKTTCVFWCGICNLQLTAPAIALQHMAGRPHKLKATKESRNQNNDIQYSKRKCDTVEPVVDEPLHKKVKDVAQEAVNQKKKENPGKASVGGTDITCDDCNLTFISTINAIQHFKGKKHASTVATKLAAKQKKNEIQRGQIRGRGQAVGGQRMSDSFGKGLGVTRGGFVNRGVSSSNDGVPVGGQYGKYIPTPDVSSVNFLPVGKKITTSHRVGLLSDYFVNASSLKNASETKNIKPHLPTVESSYSKPSVNKSESYKNDFGINKVVNMHGNNRDDFHMKSDNNIQFKSDDMINPPSNIHQNKLINDRDNFPINPPDNLEPNYPRSDRGNFSVNSTGNMQCNTQRINRSGFQNPPVTMKPSDLTKEFDKQQHDFSTPSNYGTSQYQTNPSPEYINPSQKGTSSVFPLENAYDNNPHLNKNDYIYNSAVLTNTSPEGNVSGGGGNHSYNYSTSNNSPFIYSNYNPPTFGTNYTNPHLMSNDARYEPVYDERY